MESVKAAGGAVDRDPDRPRGDAAQGLVEYALILALVALALIASLAVFRNAIANLLLPLTAVF